MPTYSATQTAAAHEIVARLVAELGTQTAAAERLGLKSSSGISLLLNQKKLTPAVYRVTIYKKRVRRCAEFTDEATAREWDALLAAHGHETMTQFIAAQLAEWRNQNA